MAGNNRKPAIRAVLLARKSTRTGLTPEKRGTEGNQGSKDRRLTTKASPQAKENPRKEPNKSGLRLDKDNTGSKEPESLKMPGKLGRGGARG
jgi:hypothetical protein